MFFWEGCKQRKNRIKVRKNIIEFRNDKNMENLKKIDICIDVCQDKNVEQIGFNLCVS